jgi:hypothetical protein
MGLATLLGCATSAPSSKLTEEVSKGRTSPEELRILVRGLVVPFSGQIEAVADQVITLSPDAQTREEMTRFKMNGIPAMQLALLRPDPVASLVDAWVMVSQMKELIGLTRAGQVPEEREKLRTRFDSMEGQLAAIWRRMAGPQDTSTAAARVHAWAAQHPVTTTLAARPTTTELLASLTATPSLSPFATVASALKETQDLSARLDAFAAFLPKQARWQGEYFLLEALSDPSFHPRIPELDKVSAEMERVSGSVEGLPGFLDEQRRAMQSFLREERVGFQEFADTQRVELTRALAQERVAGFADATRMGDAWVDRAFDRLDALLKRGLLWTFLFLTALILVVLVLLSISRTRRGHRGTRRRWSDVLPPAQPPLQPQRP